MRCLVIFIVVVISTATAFAGGKDTKPVKNRFNSFILLSAGASELRLFMPDQVIAAPGQYMEWEKSLDRYSEKWISKKKNRNDRQLLQQLFFDVHRNYLKHYTAYTGLQALLQKGEYNCVSATALYALILDRLDYSYKIVESNNHIVLVIALEQGNVLFEATDPFAGFMHSNEAVATHLANIRAEKQNSQFYSFNLKIFRTINLRELAGLQYFNSAAWLFNNKQLAEAAEAVKHGELLYQTKRFGMLKALLASN